MDMRKRGILTILVFLLLPTLVLFSVQNKPEDRDEMIEEKVYSNATLEDAFADDKVLIVLTKDASMNFRTYTLEDFPEGLFSRVEDSTGLTMELVRKQLEAEETGDWSDLQLHFENSMLVDIEKFRRILTLTLTEKSKENVLHAIKVLERREDVFSADPNYFVTASKVPSPKPTNYNNQAPSFSSIEMENA